MTNLLSSRYVRYLLCGFKWLFIGTGVFAGLLALLVMSWFWWGSYGVFRTDSFDATVWFEPHPDKSVNRCYRGGMAGDIKDRILTRDMVREDVILQLGQPDGKSTEQEYQYMLGMCSGLQIDVDTLNVYFDASGHYSQSRTVQH